MQLVWGNTLKDANMKKVLMIAQYFPPAGGVGTFRVTKFVKYLCKFEWEPVVLTVREDCYPKNVWLDHGLEKDILQDVHVYRTNIWHSRIINDESIQWLPFLLPNVAKVIRKERPDLVYLTGGPFFPLIIGPVVRLLFCLPYVIDLRDPWKLARVDASPNGLKVWAGKVLVSVIEPIIIRHATKVICVTERMSEAYRKAYHHLPAGKFVTITNGYDPEDFIDITPKKYARFTIVYTGKFRHSKGPCNPLPFFQALRILKERGIDIAFIHVGIREQEVIDLATRVGVKEIIRFVGPKPHAEALSYSMGANLLLVFGSNIKIGLPVKMFDYMGCQRPILILASKDEELVEIARRIPHTKVLENKDPEVIATVIWEIYQGLLTLGKKPNAELQYDRRYLTMNLSNVFNNVSLRRKGGKRNAHIS